MNRKLSAIYKTITIATCLLLMSPSMSYAQEYDNTPITVSKEKVKVGGKICYSHIVLEKQTLYSISKAYSVSIEDIYQFNPTLKETGLKKNSIIIIPSSEALVAESKSPEVKEESMEQMAPAQEIKVAAKKDGKKKIHIRKWYEDLEMIAAQYDVSVEDLMVENNLTDKTLTNRQKLIIPSGSLSHQDIEESDATAENSKEEKGVETKDEVISADETVSETPFEWLYTPARKINATALLPMRSMEGKISRNNMDFYCGMMLAVHDLAQKGINIDINTFDITNHEHPVTKEDIEESDVIIGPISAADQRKLFQAADQIGALVSPLDPRSERLVAEYNTLIQAPTPHRTQYEDLTSWIKEEMTENDKVFMFYERTARVNNAVEAMKEVMDSSAIAYTPFTYSILEGRDILEPLKEMMTPEGTNRIYIASESEAFVNDVIRNLNLLLLENLQVVLYAPSKVRSFETIEVEHFHKTSMRVSLAYFINYEDKAVKDFLMKYRALYNTEPSQFAFQGYDVAHHFINLCNKYGKDWVNHIEECEKDMLQSTFKFTKLGTGGYVNTGLRRIVYGPKWTINQVK